MKKSVYLLSIMIFGLSVQPSFAGEAENEIKTLLAAKASEKVLGSEEENNAPGSRY